MLTFADEKMEAQMGNRAYIRSHDLVSLNSDVLSSDFPCRLKSNMIPFSGM